MEFLGCEPCSGNAKSFLRDEPACVSRGGLVKAGTGVIGRQDNSVNRSNPCRMCLNVQLCSRNVHAGNVYVIEASLCNTVEFSGKLTAGKQFNVNPVKPVENERHEELSAVLPRSRSADSNPHGNNAMTILCPSIVLERLSVDLSSNAISKNQSNDSKDSENDESVLSSDVHTSGSINGDHVPCENELDTESTRSIEGDNSPLESDAEGDNVVNALTETRGNTAAVEKSKNKQVMNGLEQRVDIQNSNDGMTSADIKMAKLERRPVEMTNPSQRYSVGYAVSTVKNSSEKGPMKNSHGDNMYKANNCEINKKDKRFETADVASAINLREARTELGIQVCSSELSASRDAQGLEQCSPVGDSTEKNEKIRYNLTAEDILNTRAELKSNNKEKGKKCNQVMSVANREDDDCVITEDNMNSAHSKRNSDSGMENGKDINNAEEQMAVLDDSGVIVETKSAKTSSFQATAVAAPNNSLCSTKTANPVTSDQPSSAVAVNKHVGVKPQSSSSFSDSFAMFVINKTSTEKKQKPFCSPIASVPNSGSVPGSHSAALPLAVNTDPLVPAAKSAMFIIKKANTEQKRRPVSSPSASVQNTGLVPGSHSAALPLAVGVAPLVPAAKLELRPVARFVMDIGANLVGERICEEVIQKQGNNLQDMSQADTMKYDFVNSSYQRFIQNNMAYKNFTLHQCKCERFKSTTLNELEHHLYDRHPQKIRGSNKNGQWGYFCCICLTMLFSRLDYFIHMLKVHKKTVKVDTVPKINPCPFCGIAPKSHVKEHILRCRVNFRPQVNLVPGRLDCDIPIWASSDRLVENTLTSTESNPGGPESNKIVSTPTVNQRLAPAVVTTVPPVNFRTPTAAPSVVSQVLSTLHPSPIVRKVMIRAPLQNNLVRNTSTITSGPPGLSVPVAVPNRMILLGSLRNILNNHNRFVGPATVAQRATQSAYFAYNNSTTVSQMQNQIQSIVQALTSGTHNLSLSSSSLRPSSTFSSSSAVFPRAISVQPPMSSSSSSAVFSQSNSQSVTTVICFMCDLSFANYECLNKHIADTHELVSPLIVPPTPGVGGDGAGLTNQALSETCEICDFKCATSSDLFYHMTRLHMVKLSMPKFMGAESGRFFDCSYCVRRFLTQMGLSRHVRVTHPGSPLSYKCCLCAKTYLGSILAHIFCTHKITLADMFQTHCCMICMVTTGSSTERLQKHMLEHHQELFPSAAVLTEMLKRCQAVSVPADAAAIRKLAPNIDVRSPVKFTGVQVDSHTMLMLTKNTGNKSRKRMSNSPCDSSTNLNGEKKSKVDEHLEQKFMCSNCNLSFETQKKLRRHQNSEHLKFRQILESCQVCGEPESSGLAMSQHVYNTHIRKCSVVLKRLDIVGKS